MGNVRSPHHPFLLKGASCSQIQLSKECHCSTQVPNVTLEIKESDQLLLLLSLLFITGVFWRKFLQTPLIVNGPVGQLPWTVTTLCLIAPDAMCPNIPFLVFGLWSKVTLPLLQKLSQTSSKEVIPVSSNP